MKRTIENCAVIKLGLKEGAGKPLIELLNGEEYCQGYQKSESDDEPYYKCLNCKLNIWHEN